ncbi:MAG: DUF503 domain-containing protein [Clostridiales bacterium]|jgi:uncharacterized protein YlxP (DUF503 family)|nr:DUF503 domain-containing protein [Clostridiales bacterium]
MIITVETIKLYAPWVNSLKEKRTVVKSIIAKIKNKFNVSIAEVDSQDLHKTIILGIALVSGTKALGDSIMDKLNSYLQNITDAEIIEIFRETR